MFCLKILGLAAIFLLGLVLLYIISGLILPFIPVNRKQNLSLITQKATIYIKSDGIHADVILPAVHDYFNWQSIIDTNHYQGSFNQETFLSFGWGDRGFYLEIPEWSDLTAKIAFRALCLPGPTVMHVELFEQLPTHYKYFNAIEVSQQQYNLLCNYLQSFFQYANDKVIHIPDVGYTANDQFYEGMYDYHALKTCNEWINAGLKKSGICTALWSPLAFGLFVQQKRKSSYESNSILS